MWTDVIFKSKATADLYIPQIEEWRKQYLGSKVEQTVSMLPPNNLDKLWEECRAKGAVLVPCGHDDEVIALGNQTEEIKKLLFQSSDGNLTFIASCKCGQLKGNYNIGRVCPKCRTEVRTAFANEIDIHSWLEIPESLPPFLHPDAYRKLDRWIGVAKRKVSILDSIMNVNQDLPEPYLSTFGRGGMWYFYENFDDIMNFIASQKRGIRARGNDEIMEFIKRYRDRLFTRHIPILNLNLHILTHSGSDSLSYSDNSSKFILQTAIELSHTIYQQRHNPTMNKYLLEQHIFSTYKSWIAYTDSVLNDKIQGKVGFIRKNILGNRLHSSARGVITPIVNPHMADEIELPWKMVVGLYKLEIIGRLQKKFGFDANTALDYWVQAQVGLQKDEPDPNVRARVMQKMNAVKVAIDELLAECPYKGFPVTLGRNPTLRQGAIQLFFCRHYRTDWNNPTIGMAPESITAPNADFDGDSLYLFSIKEMAAVMDFMKIHPMTTLLVGEGEALCPCVKMIDEQAVAMHGYMTDDGELDIDKYYKLLHTETV